MEQIARSATQETWGYLHPCRYVLRDRDTKFCASFRSVLAAGGVKTIPLPARSPDAADKTKPRGQTVARRQRLGLLKFYGRAA
jgi:hypothetical protein